MDTPEADKILKKIKNADLHQYYDTDIVKNLRVAMDVKIRHMKLSDHFEELMYYGPEHWVLAHGKFFQGRKLPRKYRRGEPQQCYYNSFKGMSKYALPYFEGYVLGIIPILHAWNADSRGVVDLTLRSDRIIAEPDREYFGVSFKLGYLSNLLFEKKLFGSAIDDWENGWPLLRDDAKFGAAVEKDNA